MLLYKRVSNVNYNVTSTSLLLLTSAMYASFELQCLVLCNAHSNLSPVVTSTKTLKPVFTYNRYSWISPWISLRDTQDDVSYFRWGAIFWLEIKWEHLDGSKTIIHVYEITKRVWYMIIKRLIRCPAIIRNWNVIFSRHFTLCFNWYNINADKWIVDR